MDYVCTDFGVDSSSHSPFKVQTNRQTNRRDWTPYPTLAAIQPAWVITCATTHRFASSQCACFPAYSESVFVSSFVITSCDMSIRLHSRSDIVCLAYSTAPFGSRSMRIFCRQLLMRLATSGQLSRRTVSMPLQSILSCTSGRVKYRPAYRFLLIRRYGK